MNTLLIFAFIIPIIVYIILYLKVRSDQSEILAILKNRGCKDVSIYWNPLSVNSLVDRRHRHYDVSFTNRDGQETENFCKANLYDGPKWDSPLELGTRPSSFSIRQNESNQKEWKITQLIQAGIDNNSKSIN